MKHQKTGPEHVIPGSLDSQFLAHRIGDGLIPLNSSFVLIVGFYMKYTKCLTFSRVLPKGCHEVFFSWMFGETPICHVMIWSHLTVASPF